jgi:hypothetical protein
MFWGWWQVKLTIPCDDSKSRLLLEEFKSSCQKGWFYETLRWDDGGQLIYKFFLLNLAEQEELHGRKYVRYHGWVEASEAPGVININAAGALEKLLDSELQQELVQRFHDDVVVPVCKRHAVIAKLTDAACS